jgi:hypothetical protein
VLGLYDCDSSPFEIEANEAHDYKILIILLFDRPSVQVLLAQ